MIALAENMQAEPNTFVPIMPVPSITALPLVDSTEVDSVRHMPDFVFCSAWV